jgi:hypothetical protein
VADVHPREAAAKADAAISGQKLMNRLLMIVPPFLSEGTTQPCSRTLAGGRIKVFGSGP